jgi:hypothetical protein
VFPPASNSGQGPQHGVFEAFHSRWHDCTAFFNVGRFVLTFRLNAGDALGSNQTGWQWEQQPEVRFWFTRSLQLTILFLLVLHAELSGLHCGDFTTGGGV